MAQWLSLPKYATAGRSNGRCSSSILDIRSVDCDVAMLTVEYY